MSKKGMGKFITGALVGASIGVLFAPKKGSETRKDLKNKTGELIDSLKHLDKEEVKAKLNQKVKELKKDFENLNKETAKELIKEKGTALMKKADELMDVAKEKSAPIIEHAANEIKEKTIVILKNTVEKLENSEKKEMTKKKTMPKTTKKKNA